MQDLIDKQLGRILLGIAIVWSIVIASMNMSEEVTFPGEIQKSAAKDIQVELDVTTLATASPEQYFPTQDPKELRGSGKFPFVPPVKVFEFTPVSLSVPLTGLEPPPQVLPSPGPALEGTAGLPRWGEEFKPLQAPESE